MTTDFRALCAELADELTQFNAWYIEDNGYGLPALEALLRRSDAALAQSDGPAVPEGREPASVAQEPSDADLLATLNKATATFPPRHPEAEGLNAVEYPLALELRKARAVLARWGNLPESPDSSDEPAVPEGREPASVTERPTVMQLIELSDEIEAAGLGQIDFARAVLARWGNHVPDATKMVSPAPAAEGEVAELAAWLRDDLELYPAEKRRAADLLERQAAPVPVAAAGLCELADDLREQASQGYCEFISREGLRRVADVLEQLDVSAHKQEPAVGPPSDDELLELAQHHSVSYTMSDGSVVYPLQHGCDMRDDVLSFARAVLARWGHQPAPPAKGDCPACEGVPKPGNHPCAVCGRSASSAGGEVAELAWWLRSLEDASVWFESGSPEALKLTRAANLLERLSPQVPVLVSERLPRPEEMTEDSKVWIEDPGGDCEWEPHRWGLSRIGKFDAYNGLRWLPAHALPLPTAND